MANKQIPEITANLDPLDGTEQFHMVKNNNSRRVTLAEIAEYILGFRPYLVPFGFDNVSSPLIVGETLLAHVVEQAVTFPDDFANSVGYLEDAPGAQVDLDVAQDSGAGPVSVGTITLKTDGTVTFATSGAEVTFAAGETLVITPLSVDGDLTTAAFTLYGTWG